MRRAVGNVDELLERLTAHPWLLRFPQPLEREYRDDHFTKWLQARRLSLLVGLIAFALFGVVDRWASPSAFAKVLGLRAFGCALIVVIFLLSYVRAFRRIGEGALAAAVVITGATIAGMEIVMAPSDPGYELYLFGMAIALFYGFAALRLRLWVATVAGTLVLALSVAVGIDHHPVHAMVRLGVLVALLFASFVVGMVAGFFIDTGSRQNFLHERQLDRERARSDRLLLNTLPSPVAERLKRGETVADRFEEVTVLFADLVCFTELTRSMDPVEVVAFLDRLFTRFDMLASAGGLEKIKTIGDSYMAVCGLPSPCEDTAARAADMALGMLSEVRDQSRQWDLDVRLRVGLHSGPVVAGVIGVDKFSYDLWGDTVNTASRMESHGMPDRIQVSEATYERLRSAYRFEGPRIVDVKGKGPMPTYLLVAPASPEEVSPAVRTTPAPAG